MNQMSDKMVVYNDMESRVAFKCNVEQELKDLWELVSKTWYVKDSDSTVIYRAPRMDDTILFYLQRTVERKPFVWRSEIVRYPPRGAPNLKNINITGVAIIDSKRTGMGGEASILNGGIGFDFVDIKLQSNWFCGYSFTIVIIGKYMDTDSEVNSVYQRFTDITND
ncbi:uncharacterized protein LOC128964003 [Oppia nitens]|uniref:uncharacterized protein LOC128964003 n=1 Tax=Oppia nitens TaxID=1686743 RepID=UPI0023DA4187|nr:uncharacterized protein LOC128964003 [Oppia nitens]